MTEALDPRLHAFRADLADIALAGRVEARRFAAGQPFRVAAATAPVRASASAAATMLTEALHGEPATVFETTPEGWCWVQLMRDRYVGWIERAGLAAGREEPTHRVTALRTFAFAAPDIKTAPLIALPLGASVRVAGEAEDRNARYGLIEPAGAIALQHLKPLGSVAADWVGVAERFLGAPYLWGGKTSLGIDCSGLLQVALGAGGAQVPRDADLQERALGTAIPEGERSGQLRRGDLVFWPGHAGIMVDGEMLLHANAFHMEVAAEPLAQAVARAASRGVAVSSVRRLA